MPDELATLAAGFPVEVGGIDKELKKLWKQEEDVAARASLMNLAVYSEEPGSLARNTELIAQITQDHACRAIVIELNPHAPRQRVQAWISAHCHITRAGARHACSEQISFLIEGQSRELVPNIVFSHLDSDLPLHLWWQGALPETVDRQLWDWVDRLICDSGDWPRPAHQFALLHQIARANGRPLICDLNWTRLADLRPVLAQLFDHPAALACLPEIRQVAITCAPDALMAALLLAGWLAAQLQWEINPEGSTRNRLLFSGPGEAGWIEIEITGSGSCPIGSCLLDAGEAQFEIHHDATCEVFRTRTRLPGERDWTQTIPAGRHERVDLIKEELMRGGRKQLYQKALAKIEPILGKL